MRRISNCIAVLFLLLVGVGTARAQMVYFCNFEDSTEVSQWHLNPMKSTLSESDFDQVWYIGTPGQCGPSTMMEPGHGLFISADSAESVCYKSSRSSYIAAYRDLTLPAGTYTIRFDWRLMGKQNDEIIVGWVDRNTKCNGSPAAAQAPSLTNAQKISKGGKLNGKAGWEQFSVSFTVPANTTNGRLVFYFSCGQGIARNPGAAIDNIEIMQGNCPAPTNVKYSTNAIGISTLSWSGSGSHYDIRYYSYQAGVWYEINNYLGKSIAINLQDEGFTYFYVRQVCDSVNNIHSQWASTSAFAYIPGRRCIEYLDLGKGGASANAGQCYASNFANYVNTPNNNGTGVAPAPATQSGDHAVLHVLHTDPSEIDPHTQDAGGLRTVPEGEIASVRLGGRQYESTGLSARVVYKYRVQPGISDLMILKYAVVMENPNHGEAENPRMMLEILDGNGNYLDGCTQAEFRAGAGDTESWHTENWEGGTVLWSDWQTVTVSLRQYVGQTLTIRLTTTRCTYDTHYSYTYFTMGCQSGDFEGIACGDFETDRFVAPEGFYYRWRKPSDPSKGVISREQELHIEKTDTCIYTVDMISKTDTNCYYVLTANPNPRFPQSHLHLASMADSVYAENCSYTVTFENNAYVALVNRMDTSKVTRAPDPIDGIEWDFGDGGTKFTTDTFVTYTYPKEGGTFWVKSSVSMSNGVCVSEPDSMLLILAPLVDKPRNLTPLYGCIGKDPVTYKGEKFYRDTTLLVPRDYRGCTVEDTLRIIFDNEFYSQMYDTICQGQMYRFHGMTYDKTGHYEVPRKSSHGTCDSTFVVDLKVLPLNTFQVSDTVIFCDDDPVFDFPVRVKTGVYAGVEILPDQNAISAGFQPRYQFPAPQPYRELDGALDTVYQIRSKNLIRPGYYRFNVVSMYGRCESDPQPFEVVLRYSDKVLYQKDGYIVLYNPEYNYGGYEFSNYKWYRDGLLLPDTKSYLQPTAEDLGHIYQVELLRADDSVSVMSCPMVYNGTFVPHTTGPKAPIRSSVSPTMVRRGSPLMVSGEGDVRIYDALGRPVLTAPVDSEDPVSVPSPSRDGVYIVVINHEAFRVLVQ